MPPTLVQVSMLGKWDDQPEIFKNPEKTIKNIAQTKPVSVNAMLLADYETDNDSMVRQTIMITKNSEGGEWMGACWETFKSLIARSFYLY